MKYYAYNKNNVFVDAETKTELRQESCFTD